MPNAKTARTSIIQSALRESHGRSRVEYIRFPLDEFLSILKYVSSADHRHFAYAGKGGGKHMERGVKLLSSFGKAISKKMYVSAFRGVVEQLK
jgi:hypothetical protein